MLQRPDLNQLSNEQLRVLTADLFDRMENKDRALVHRDAVIEKLTHEVAILKRHKFAQRSEQLGAVQGNLLDELIDGDLAAIEAELGQLTAIEAPTKAKKQQKRAPLPPELPRTLIHHEPENTQCRCGCQLKRVGEDVSEKLDYVPGEFTVERRIRGKWACEQCETLVQAPVPAALASTRATSWATGRVSWSATITQVIKRALIKASPKSAAWLIIPSRFLSGV
jgi:hypothetical protein